MVYNFSTLLSFQDHVIRICPVCVCVCACVCVCMRVMYFIVHYHSHMVLDEADQMLERGFAESVEEVLDEVFHDSKNCKCHVFA